MTPHSPPGKSQSGQNCGQEKVTHPSLPPQPSFCWTTPVLYNQYRICTVLVDGLSSAVSSFHEQVLRVTCKPASSPATTPSLSFFTLCPLNKEARMVGPRTAAQFGSWVASASLFPGPPANSTLPQRCSLLTSFLPHSWNDSGSQNPWGVERVMGVWGGSQAQEQVNVTALGK